MVLTDAQCKELEKPPSCVPEGINYCDGKRTIYVTYGGESRTVNGRLYRTRSLKEFLDFDAESGDIFQFLPGKYWVPSCKDPDDVNLSIAQPIRLKDLKGEPDKPIKIKGKGLKTILCGNNAAVPGDNVLPSLRHFAFFKIIDCAWVEIEDFNVESCWPCFVYIEDSQYISVRDINAIDSQYLVFARGEKSHHILIENNSWQQDPTGTLWKELIWEDVHDYFYNYLSGGLFGTKDITGSVVIRKNTIRDAFNGIRMSADRTSDKDKSNLNVEIYENTFERLRDNAIEPEGAATNWMMHHNRIYNVHAWFSFDRVGRGFWFIFSNLGWFDDRPGQIHDEMTGGKVLKFHRKKPYPKLPVYVFNNSWYLRTFIVKKGKTEHLNHYNNAVQFCKPKDHRECVCKSDRNFIGKNFPDGEWPFCVKFDYDLSNKDFSCILRDNHQEQNGRVDPNFSFRDPRKGDLRPEKKAKVPKGKKLFFKAKTGWPGEKNWPFDSESLIPRMGAYQEDGRLLDGPPFSFYRPDSSPDWYDEPPRIVRVERYEPKKLIIHFSVPLSSSCPEHIYLSNPDTEDELIKVNTVIKETRIILNLNENWDGPPISTCSIHLPKHIRSQGGLAVTLWACADGRVVLI